MGEGKFGGEIFCRTYPDFGSRHGIRSSRCETGVTGALASSNSAASGTPNPVAIFSNTTAVGLLSPRSTKEIIERLTAHLAANASRLIPNSVRKPRTRPAIRELMPCVATRLTAFSLIVDILSNKQEALSIGYL